MTQQATPPLHAASRLLHADRVGGVEHGAVHKPLHAAVAYGYPSARALAGLLQSEQTGRFCHGDTPTLAELGYKDFEASSWYGVLAPAGTPEAIVQQLNKAINQALKQPDVAEKLRSEGGDVLGGTPQAFAQLLRTEVPRWGRIVKDSGASLD